MSGCSLLTQDKQPPARFHTILRPSTSYFVRYDLHTVRFSTSQRTRVAVGFSTIRFTSRKFQPRGFTPCHRMLKYTSYLRTTLFTHTHTHTHTFRNGLQHFVNAMRQAQFNFFLSNPSDNQTDRQTHTHTPPAATFRPLYSVRYSPKHH